MRLSNFILHNDILLIHATINNYDYIFTVKWATVSDKMGGEWELKSYINNSTGKKDLSENVLQQFLDQINPQWDWKSDQEQLDQALEQDGIS
ncbi:hypothetical protein SH601_15705 [Gracilibacillus sp. S3-1-1]|uniref:Uncharacterized protein n=1 Tax=Gracilibacillus pellucidus TaxID=3095368 RepID=A0ACC6M8V5_9BACI|nr:hypothetical protein [Gracilibacillus sp. S3-1-1]MDX8047413.1 hypothetical protein [Gracilibacillus sp. S3-1-1]